MPRLILAALLLAGAALPAAAQGVGNGATTCAPVSESSVRCTTSVEMRNSTLLRGVSVRFVPGNVPGLGSSAQGEAFFGECGSPLASLGRMPVLAGRGVVTFPTRVNYGIIPPRTAIGPMCVEVVLSSCSGGNCTPLLPGATIAVSFRRE